MRFQHLAIGARFEYEGRVYVKTGPIAAASEQGRRRMIPRHAVLRPLDGGPVEAPPKPERRLDEAAVLAAFEAFYRECMRQVDAQGALALAAARQRFLASLGSE